jgi:alanyl-tRNA synthetase
MTIKLYYTNPYIKEFTTEIIETKLIDDKYHIVLKETAFYPEGGGQPCDLGEINGIEVSYVYEENNIIYHVVDEFINKASVFCSIDFERRLDHMQQHSGEHLLSAMFLKLFKGKNVGFHLGKDYVTLDISIPDVSKVMVMDIENMVNELVYKNIPVKTYVINQNQLSSVPIRKETSITENIRIVEIDKVDYSACCGTHVNTTGEIGIIKIIKTEKYKGNTRVYFKCGVRALRDYSHKHNIAIELMKLMSSDENNIINSVKNLNTTIRENNKLIKDLKERIYKIEADDLVDNLKGNICKRIFNEKNSEEISNIGKLIFEKNINVLLCTTMENTILFSVPDNCSIDCGAIFKDNIKKFNGKGGGSHHRAQGSFTNTEDLLMFYKHIENYIDKILKI